MSGQTSRFSERGARDEIVERLDDIADSLPDRWRHRQANARVDAMMDHYNKRAAIPFETRLVLIQKIPNEDVQSAIEKEFRPIIGTLPNNGRDADALGAAQPKRLHATSPIARR